MSWCDKLAATPGIGVKLDKSFTPVSTLLESLTPLLSKWIDAKTDKPAFSLDGAPDLFACSLTTLDGYQYVIGPEAFAVEFKYRLRVTPQSAGPPIAEMLSKPQPYTELLPETAERLIELIRLTTTGKPARKLLRIGIVSTTLVSMDEAPPGIVRFLKHVVKPWSDTPEYFDIQVTANLAKRKAGDFDRCIHLVQRQEGTESDLLSIRLDWQRYLGAERGLSLTSLPELLESAKRDALSYFEDVGEGARFDD